MPKKPKSNYSAENMPEKDRCQSPSYAIDPILPHIPQDSLVWEPAAGEGFMVEALWAAKYQVHATDLLMGFDFFKTSPPASCEYIVTNPPFSLKFKWLARCYDLGLPFALLMPADTLFAASANKLFQKHGVEIFIVNPRIDFYMPEKGWDGAGAQMATAWFTWGLGIGQMISFYDISAAKKKFKESL